jgi:alkaline phosphatase
MATGDKVITGVISTAQPPPPGSPYVWGDDLPTLLEIFRDQGKATGLVTTAFLTNATPAAFGAHATNRLMYDDIAGDYLSQTRPNILLGGGGNSLTPAAAQAAGYTVVQTRAELQSVDLNTTSYLCGQFGVTDLPYESAGLGDLPHLSDMTAAALDLADNDPDGLFLMIEGALIDDGAHAHSINNVIQETLEFARSVQLVIDWAAGRDDTLIIVTADHETGGLSVLESNGQGNLPTVSWSSTDHTLTNVPIYAWGPGSELVAGTLDNTQIFTIAQAPEPAPLVLLVWPLLVAAGSRRRPVLGRCA